MTLSQLTPGHEPIQAECSERASGFRKPPELLFGIGAGSSSLTQRYTFAGAPQNATERGTASKHKGGSVVRESFFSRFRVDFEKVGQIPGPGFTVSWPSSTGQSEPFPCVARVRPFEPHEGLVIQPMKGAKPPFQGFLFQTVPTHTSWPEGCCEPKHAWAAWAYYYPPSMEGSLSRLNSPRLTLQF